MAITTEHKRAYNAAYRRANAEKLSTYDKAYHIRNKEKKQLYRKERWVKYKERLSAYYKRYQKANAAQINAYNRQWYAKHIESERASGIAWYHANESVIRCRRYGITIDAYREMLSRQNGACAICLSLPGRSRLHIDHNHDTGRVRGLLCSRCNAGVGMFKDNHELMLAAVEYVQLQPKE